MKKILFSIIFLIGGLLYGQQLINIGTSANDGTGDPLRTAFGKHNTNVTAVYDSLSHIYTEAQVNARLLLKLNIADSLTMLSRYARKNSPTFTGTVTLPASTSIGTVSATELSYVNNVTSAIQTQFTGKVNVSDTASMLSTYGKASIAALKLAKSDTASMLTPYVNHNDTASMLSKYARKLSPVFTTPNIGTATGSITGNAATVTGFTPAGGSLTLSGADALTVTTTGARSLTVSTDGTVLTDANTALGVALADSANGLGTDKSYVTGKDFKTDKATLVPYSGATSTLAMGTQQITGTDGGVAIQGSKSGGNIISGINQSSTTESTGVFGQSYGSSTGEYNGVKGLSNGANTGTNNGVYGYASGGTYNNAGYFLGNLKVDDGKLILLGIDTCKGGQVKGVPLVNILRVTAACTLKGLTGGVEGQLLFILNTSASTLVLKHVGSASQNFYISGGSDLTMTGQGNSVTCFFDGYYWYIVGKGQ